MEEKEKYKHATKIKILINYEYQYYPFTTASYYEMAMRRRNDIEVFRLTDELPQDLDFILNIEPVGKFIKIPGVKCAYYEIDNHVIQGRENKYYDQADILYLAQWEFKDFYTGYPAYDLPLAFDRQLHKPFPKVEEKYEIGMLGNDTYPERRKLLEQMKEHYVVLTGNAEPGIPYSKKLSSCKMLFNFSMNKDINMRVFESIGIGKLLLTDRIPHLDKFFVEDEHYIGYSDWKELKMKIMYYQHRSCYRNQIARAGHAHGLKFHTYDNRLDLVLQDLAGEKGVEDK